MRSPQPTAAMHVVNKRYRGPRKRVSPASLVEEHHSFPLGGRSRGLGLGTLFASLWCVSATPTPALRKLRPELRYQEPALQAATQDLAPTSSAPAKPFPRQCNSKFLPMAEISGWLLAHSSRVLADPQPPSSSLNIAYHFVHITTWSS